MCPKQHSSFHLSSFALVASVLKLFRNKSWLGRIWASNVNNVYNSDKVCPQWQKHWSLTDEFSKDKKEFSYWVTFCIFMWPYPSSTDAHEVNGKSLPSVPRDRPLSYIHTAKTRDHHKHEAYLPANVCLYKMLKNPSCHLNFFCGVQYF